VEWRFNGGVVDRFTNTSNIAFEKMQLRLYTRNGCECCAFQTCQLAGISMRTLMAFSYTAMVSKFWPHKLKTPRHLRG
jgi:hypothetical protein